MRKSRMSLFCCPIFLLLLLLVSPQLVACGEPRYPVLDSKFPAAEAKLGWIDNERVIFHGYEVGKPSPDAGHPMAATGLFIWDTVKGTVTKYWDVDGPVPLCVFHDRVSFLLRLNDEKNIRIRVAGNLGKEEQTRTLGDDWVNSFSCRHHEKKPKWLDEKRIRVGLREEHGYLDFGPWRNADHSVEAQILFYRLNETEPLTLTLNLNHVWNLFEYVEFENAYLLRGKASNSDAVPVWLLKPDGAVRNLLEPKGKAWERIGWSSFHLTQKGLFLVGGQAGYTEAGTAGGYLLAEDRLKRLIAGLVWNESISPNGCKVAFVHVLHSQAGADSAQALRASKPGSRTLKMIDLCGGE